jgi:hypothetical protein
MSDTKSSNKQGFTVSQSDVDNIKRSTAAKKSQKTVGKNGKSNTKVESNYRVKKSKHIVLKTAIGAYALKTVHDGHCYKKAVKAKEEADKCMQDYQEATRYFSHGSGSNNFDSCFGDAFERALIRQQMEDAENKLKKYQKRKERQQAAGRFIGKAVASVGMASRTLAMKSAMEASTGATNGDFNRDKITKTAVAGDFAASCDDDVGQIEY